MNLPSRILPDSNLYPSSDHFTYSNTLSLFQSVMETVCAVDDRPNNTNKIKSVFFIILNFRVINILLIINSNLLTIKKH